MDQLSPDMFSMGTFDGRPVVKAAMVEVTVDAKDWIE